MEGLDELGSEPDQFSVSQLLPLGHQRPANFMCIVFTNVNEHFKFLFLKKSPYY